MATKARSNGRYLLTTHEGRITKFAHVPPDQVILEGVEGEQGDDDRRE